MDESLDVSRSTNDSWIWIEAGMIEREGEKDMKHAARAVLPIPKHPERNVSCLSLILLLCCLVETMVAGVFFSQSSLDSTLTLKITVWMTFGETGLCFAFLIVMGYRRVHALQGLERRRRACTREKSVRTAASEVASQGEISPLLCAITAFPQRAAVWRRVVYLSLGAVVLCLVPFIGMLVGGDVPVFMTIMLILAGFFSFLCVRIAFFFFKAEITIEAREGGLQVKKRGDGVLTEHIAWDEARLFACYTLPNVLPGEKIQYYELSSSTQEIIWIGVSGTVVLVPLWRSAPSAQEDHRQMQVLCDVITTKTGLALCDLTHPREDR